MRILIAIATLSIVGCAHPRVIGFDNDTHTVAVQTTAYGNAKDAQEKADQHCGGKASLVSAGMKNTGAQYIGYGMVSNTEQPVFTFRCPSSL